MNHVDELYEYWASAPNEEKWKFEELLVNAIRIYVRNIVGRRIQKYADIYFDDIFSAALYGAFTEYTSNKGTRLTTWLTTRLKSRCFDAAKKFRRQNAAMERFIAARKASENSDLLQELVDVLPPRIYKLYLRYIQEDSLSIAENKILKIYLRRIKNAAK